MPGPKKIAWAAAILLASAAHPQPRPAVSFDGEAALEWTRKAVAFGPRPAGSAAQARLRHWLVSELRRLKCQVEEDSFTARTPRGPVSMTNIIARFPGASGRVVVVSGHYETYDRPGLRFVGANDGGSSTGFLLELARTLARDTLRDSVWLVWFDGEESLVNWTGEDHTYGSRRQARRWQAEGKLPSLLALINVDMIGDADLSLVYEQYSTPWLRDLVWSVAGRLGYAAHFSKSWSTAVEDDHVPFLEAGVAAVNLIDYDYGPANSYWHTERDTPDKLSAGSFQIIGRVVRETLRALELRAR